MKLIDSIILMVNEHKKAALDVKKSSKVIEEAVHLIVNHLIKYPKGRMIYVGSGTSGRIGIQDCAELFPTFNLL